MCTKTATSVLKEFCERQKVAAPQYEAVNNDNDPRLFIVVVEVCGFLANGTGRTKSDAKHLASERLIDILQQQDEYTETISQIKYGKRSNPQTGASNVPKLLPNTGANGTVAVQNNDAVGALITFCLNHQLTTPEFYDVSVDGADHLRVFTMGCRIGHNQCNGTAPQKKKARQIAAIKMLELLDENSLTSDDSADSERFEAVPWVIPLLEMPSVKDVLDEYRRLRKPHIKPVTDPLRYRRNFFLKFPEANKKMAQDILKDDEIFRPIEIIDRVLKALNLKYTVERMQNNNRRFALVDCDFDCVIVGREHELLPKVVNYFKTMLNVQNVEEAIADQEMVNHS